VGSPLLEGFGDGAADGGGGWVWLSNAVWQGRSERMHDRSHDLLQCFPPLPLPLSAASGPVGPLYKLPPPPPSSPPFPPAASLRPRSSGGCFPTSPPSLLCCPPGPAAGMGGGRWAEGFTHRITIEFGGCLFFGRGSSTPSPSCCGAHVLAWG